MGGSSVEALKGINFSVEKGEFIAIMGPSGSGKTTLMNIIGCLDTPSSGEYLLNNKPVKNQSEDDLANIRNKEIGFVFQSFRLLAKNSALDNVLLPLKYAGKGKKESIERATEVLKEVGLELEDFSSEQSFHQNFHDDKDQNQNNHEKTTKIHKPSDENDKENYIEDDSILNIKV